MSALHCPCLPACLLTGPSCPLSPCPCSPACLPACSGCRSSLCAAARTLDLSPTHIPHPDPHVRLTTHPPPVPCLACREVPGWTLDLEDLFPGKNYFSYTGSLTTPPCSEGVMWHVSRPPPTTAQLAEVEADCLAHPARESCCRALTVTSVALHAAWAAQHCWPTTSAADLPFIYISLCARTCTCPTRPSCPVLSRTGPTPKLRLPLPSPPLPLSSPTCRCSPRSRPP